MPVGGLMSRVRARSSAARAASAASGSSARTASTHSRLMTGRCSTPWVPAASSVIVTQARSTAPVRSASRQRWLERSVWNSSPTSGYSRQNSFMAAPRKLRMVVAPVAMTTPPPCPVRSSSSSRRPSPSAVSPSEAARWRIRPASVGATPRD
ncbi:hypothetical protein SMD11_3078 [Streptomyces albireticuli]|uniref:Uncharacterized protein n=1 Tax=Streptomyces albireticuli TaxID=1940 RepID=A0A1Z2L332_9ACTN|nr:hypothetical protein SMD11_3078 [Streptomyces albireticuli]